MNILLNDARPEWLTDLLYSGWFYAAIVIGFFFVIILLVSLWGLFNKSCKHETRKDNGTLDTLPLDYSALLKIVSQRNGHAHCTLFAAASLTDLPVTIPVHVALQAAVNSRCLLIDLDIRRNALASVFELSDKIVPTVLSPLSSGIENLDLWPSHFFSRLRQMDLKTLLAAANKKYDVILLNVPYLATHPDRTQIIRLADSAVVFAKDKNTLPQLKQLLDTGRCRILKAFSPQPNP